MAVSVLKVRKQVLVVQTCSKCQGNLEEILNKFLFFTFYPKLCIRKSDIGIQFPWTSQQVSAAAVFVIIKIKLGEFNPFQKGRTRRLKKVATAAASWFGTTAAAAFGGAMAAASDLPKFDLRCQPFDWFNAAGHATDLGG